MSNWLTKYKLRIERKKSDMGTSVTCMTCLDFTCLEHHVLHQSAFGEGSNSSSTQTKTLFMCLLVCTEVALNIHWKNTALEILQNPEIHWQLNYKRVESIIWICSVTWTKFIANLSNLFFVLNFYKHVQCMVFFILWKR